MAQRTNVGTGPRGRTLEERLLSKVQLPADPFGCWEWIGAKNAGNGYGVIQVDGKRKFAHRVSHEIHLGPIPKGLEIDHVCRNRACVSPLHLEAVTPSTNVRRRPDRMVTHCPKGHPYSGDNLRLHTDSRGYTRRLCRECNIITSREDYAKVKAAKNAA